LIEHLAQYGYGGLFLASFLAATLLPLGSEVILSLMLLQGLSPALLVTFATAGNVLGSIVNYAIGYWGGTALIKRFFSLSDQQLLKTERRYRKYGVFSLLFAWVPVIGDPLTVIAGLLRIPIVWFFTLVLIGKLSRYLIISYITLNS